MALANEMLFKKVYSNAERMLEHQALGWMSQALEEVRSPIPIQPFVEKTLKQCSTKGLRCKKPDVETGEMLVVLKALSQTGAYGTLYANLITAWQIFYEQKSAA
jgi:hypothetical protein|tara:strand:- start:1664 stop:1975 length:312 start_codon:yes stop_codon:yes gene_type:complete